MLRMDAPSVSVMLRSWDLRTGVTPQMTLDAARQAEAAGLDGILAGDHVTFHGYGNDRTFEAEGVGARNRSRSDRST